MYDGGVGEGVADDAGEHRGVIAKDVEGIMEVLVKVSVRKPQRLLNAENGEEEASLLVRKEHRDFSAFKDNLLRLCNAYAAVLLPQGVGLIVG